MLVRPQAFAGFSPMISTMKRRLSAIQLFPFCMHAFGVLDESRYGFRLSSGRRHIGHTDRTIHRIALRSEEHTSELQSLMRISYAVFCLKKKTTNNINNKQ